MAFVRRRTAVHLCVLQKKNPRDVRVESVVWRLFHVVGWPGRGLMLILNIVYYVFRGLSFISECIGSVGTFDNSRIDN